MRDGQEQRYPEHIRDTYTHIVTRLQIFAQNLLITAKIYELNKYKKVNLQ